MTTQVADRGGFPGHIVGRTGLACDLEKISAVRARNAPGSIKHVRQFVRFIGYYRHFMPDFAGLSESCLLGRKGPFLTERTPSVPDCFGHGCLFRCTTYRTSDYTQLTRQFGVPLHHPQFLDMGQERWLHSLTQKQAIGAASQHLWEVRLIVSWSPVFAARARVFNWYLRIVLVAGWAVSGPGLVRITSFPPV